MAEDSYPFDNNREVREPEWARMGQAAARDGVLMDTSELYPFADLAPLALGANSTNLTVTVAPGRAWLRGFLYDNTAQLSFTPAAAHPSLPRRALLVLRLDRGAKKINVVLLEGTPANPPRDPALTRNETVYEMPLWRLTVRAGVVTYYSDEEDLVDLRVPVHPPSPPEPAVRALPAGQQRSGRRVLNLDDHLEYVFDGLRWCIAPGQLIAQRSFRDNGKRNVYRQPHRIGEGSGELDSEFSFYVPWALPRHGFRVHYRVQPYTFGSTLHDRMEVRLVAFFGNTSYQYFMIHPDVVHGAYGAGYNGMISGSAWFPQAGNAQLIGGRVQRWCVDGFCPTGEMQWVDGQVTVVSE